MAQAMGVLKEINSKMDKMDTRIGSLESRDAQTTSDDDTAAAVGSPITSRTLKADANLSGKVRERMATLRLLEDCEASDDDSGKTKTSKGKKSGRLRTAHEIAQRELDWPHYYVYRTDANVERKGARFHDLTVQEFAYGFLSQIRQGSDDEGVRTKMYRHLEEIMRDAADFPWVNVRNYHGILMSQMEMNRLTWADTAAIQELRVTYVHRAPAHKYVTDIKKHDGKKLFCLPYQEGRCSY